MDMESQKILFALSTPMEIRNECCLPSHSSPKMYLGTCFFDLLPPGELMPVMTCCAQFTE
ncbi:hypothetical protein BvCmsNSP015_01534 [Escherichia coli]|nr:hypothetical protein SE14002_0663 [Escherichia coli]BCS69966.1 hypothetical protein CEC14159_0605 [Escherichia coli]GDP47399.1 hypothetical protein BvCmsNSP015_01534 [Escherichia coli]